MKSRVLIVDDNKEMLNSLKEGFEGYQDVFTVSTVGDGLLATEKLHHENFALVVIEMQMTTMGGLNLLSYIVDDYPHIAVFVLTSFRTDDMEKLPIEGSAVTYIEKPFIISDLAEKISVALNGQSDGGILHNVTTSMFIQLIEMEQKTCTLRLHDESSGKNGVLFFSEGELLEAITSDMKGDRAACEIFSWDQVTLAIQNSCVLKEHRIKDSLQSILLKAMHNKDENMEVEATASKTGLHEPMPEIEPVLEIEPELEIEPYLPNRIDTIKQKIEKGFGQKSGVEDISIDNSWQEFVTLLLKIGDKFESEKAKIVYVSRGEDRDFILLPEEDIAVVSVSPKCPRDSIIQALSDNL